MKKVFSEKDIPQVASGLVTYVQKKVDTTHATIVTLSGDLGAGKTTLSQAIAKEFGVTTKVVSPTFTILKTYKVKNKHWDLLQHIDAYRLEKPEEIVKIGWAELVANPRNIILLEWPEKIEEFLPQKVHSVRLSHVSDLKREIHYT